MSAQSFSAEVVSLHIAPPWRLECHCLMLYQRERKETRG